MSIYWLGGATAVAHVATGSIDSVDGTPANNTFTVTIGTESVSAAGDTDVATTATNLRAALNASTHPVFSTVTWSGSSGDITGTADVAGIPLDAVLSVSGAGSGSVTDFADSTANAGPSDWNTAANWSGGAVPVSTDDVVVDRGSDILFGLAQASVTLGSLTVLRTYTGKIGLNAAASITTVDGSSPNSSYPEARQTYLRIGADLVDVGQHFGPGSPQGSQRIKIDNAKSGASTNTIHAAPRASSETGFPAVRMLAAHASGDFIVRSAANGFGLAVDVPGETATIGDLSVTDITSTSRVYTGPGVTLTTWTQEGGVNVLQAAATVTSVDAHGGEVSLEGEYLVTTLTNDDATVRANNVPAAGAAVTTATLNGGTTDASQNAQARTWTTVNLAVGADLIRTDALTITNLNLPDERATLSVA